MPEETVRLAVPHGVIVVGDREEPAPASFGGATVVASDGAVAVVTRHEVDGDVTIRLADETEVRPLAVRAFSGRLTLPSGRLTVCNTSNEVLLQAAVPGGVARVTVWTNDPATPDEVVIAVG